MRRSRLLLATTLLACEPGGPSEPQPSEAWARIEVPSSMQAPKDLRVAVAYREGVGDSLAFVTTADRPLEKPGERIWLPLELPPPEARFD